MKKLLFALMLMTSLSVSAKEVVVSAFGEGEDYDWAVLNAVENAVRQTNDISIESNGLHKIDASSSITRERVKTGNSSSQVNATLNATGEYGKKGNLDAKGGYQRQSAYEETDGEKITAGVKDNSKHIPAKYKGIVSSYEVVEHTQNDGKHQVKINATVTKEDVYDPHDYKSKKLVKKADYSLAVLPFKATKKFNCLGKKVSIDELNTLISDAFVEQLTPTRKFNLIDRNHLDSYAAEIALITEDMTLPENKVKLKNIVSADYILVGTIENFSATTSKDYVELTGETTYESSSKLKISYRILETATMEIVSAGSVEKKFSKEDAFSSCLNVEDLLVNKAVKDASNQLLTDIFSDYQPKKAEVKKEPKKSKPLPKEDYSLDLG